MKDMAQRYRFFAENLSTSETTLSTSESHHALHVLRLRTGDAVELFDGHGGSADGEILRAAHGEVDVAIKDRRPSEARTGPVVHLAFAVPKGKRLDWLLEKATELSAASLRAVVFERSVAGGDELTDAKRDRWLGHCIAAAKQSGLNFLPELRPTQTLAEYLAGEDAPLRLLGDAGADAQGIREILSEATGELAVLVGPEGGLTAAERSAAVAAGFVPARLGRTTLRVETAAVAMLAVAQSLQK
jgi:16S rRNA (uracil1498-N3)-methyltransferase